jgi:CelD/BcsL family acetyltransferase involved in cellulose biosynthesis
VIFAQPRHSDPRFERRRVARPRAFVNAHGYRVEALDHRRMAIHRDEWLSLASHSIEPNIFFEPGFALPAAHFFVADPPLFVVVRRLVEGRMLMVGVCLISQRDMRLGRRTVRVWRHPYSALGMPLLDNRYFKGAFDAILDWLAHNRRSALLVPELGVDGPFARMLVARARRLGSRVSIFDLHERPVLHAGQEVELSANARRALVRNHSRLAEQGPTHFQLARDTEEFAEAIERFLTLESGGWKGRRGTALANDAAAAPFARSIVRALAETSACSIGSLEHNGHPIAMFILLGRASSVVCWKTAFDEGFGKYSPGLLLMAFLTESLLADPHFEFADSCTVIENMTVSRMWKSRIRVGDLMVAVSSRFIRFRVADAHERLRRSARHAAKAFLRATWDRRRG